MHPKRNVSVNTKETSKDEKYTMIMTDMCYKACKEMYAQTIQYYSYQYLTPLALSFLAVALFIFIYYSEKKLPHWFTDEQARLIWAKKELLLWFSVFASLGWFTWYLWLQ